MRTTPILFIILCMSMSIGYAQSSQSYDFKAVQELINHNQELNNKHENQQQIIDDQKNRISELENRLTQIEKLLMVK